MLCTFQYFHITNIKMFFQIYLLFETTELTYCSPAAVSCCGVIYHQSGSISWEAYFHTWLDNLENKSTSQIIKNFVDKYLDAILEFPFKSLESSKVMLSNHIHSIASFCKILNSLLKNVSIAILFFSLVTFCLRHQVRNLLDRH